MPRPRRKDQNREVKIGEVSWLDLQAMGALTAILTYFGQKKQTKKQEERKSPRHDPKRHEPETGKQPQQELTAKEQKDAMKALYERTKREGPVTVDGRYGERKFSPREVRPGTLLNASNPDILPMLYRKPKVNLRRRKEPEGNVPKYWHRQSVDGKIFGGSLVKGGIISRGSVLVDLSGSMFWTEETIKLLLNNLPEGTVYGYGGGGYGSEIHGSHYGGRWMLLADRGRAVQPSLVQEWRHWVGMDNMVDIPCLEYLAHLPGPRIWVSDTEVTGIGGYSSSLQYYSWEFCESHGISIVPHAHYLPEFLKTGRCRKPHIR